jgi:DNA alkylation damage repair protein AlkB
MVFPIKMGSMKINSPRSGFVIVEDYFSAEQAAEWLSLILKLGEDPQRGFHHPLLRPNRFHKAPRYPVKKYMGLGLYWDPLDYKYHEKIPSSGSAPHEIPQVLKNLCTKALAEFFPWPGFRPEGVIVNFYTKDSSMGLHVDKDEEDQQAPVIGLNFGSTTRFFFEDENKNMKDLLIPGNSLYIFGQEARLMRHGIGTNYANTLSPGSEKFLVSKERLNLTVRQVFKAPA